MRQVSQTVGIVTLFLLMLPHALRSENNSLDGQQLKRNVEKSMHLMAKNLEQGLPINQAETKRISKAFKNLTSKYQSKLDKIVFNIKPKDDAHIRFSYDKIKTTTGRKNIKKEPKYFLNFEFNNNLRPKVSMDKNSLSKKVEMRRNSRNRFLPNGMPNPYNYFPLKGEDI